MKGRITGASGAGEITNVFSTAALVPLPLVAVKVAANVPACCGVPVISPLTWDNERPGGRPVAVNEEGLFEAVS